MPNDNVELEKVSSPFNSRLDARNRNYYPRQNYDPLYDPYDDQRNNNDDGDGESSLNMRELWLMVRRRKWLVLTLIALITTIVTIQMYRTKSYYQANSTLEIGKENAAIGREGIAVAQSEDFDPFFMVNIKTKMLWFTSKALLEDIVVNLKLNENQKFLDTTDKSWFGSAEKKTNTDNLPNTIPAGMETEIMRSPAESAKLAPYVKLIEENLTVQQVRDTRALTISYVHTDPLIAAQINNELMRVFRQKNFTNKMGGLEQTGDWLKASERKVKAELDQAQAALASYARDKGIINVDGSNKTIVSAKLADIQSRLAAKDADLLKAESLNEDVKQGHVAKLAAEFDDKGEKMSKLQQDLGNSKKELEVLNVKYGDDHPSVREVKSKIAEIERQIKSGTKSLEDKLRVDFERAKRERNAVEREYFVAKSEAVNENQADIKLQNLKLEVDRKLKLYNDLQDKSQQAELKQKEQYNNIRIIDPAQIPNVPAGPRRTLTILLAFLLSTAAAIGLAFFLEYLDNTIKTVEDVERYAKLPALGVIPAIAGSTSLKKLPGRSEELLDGNGTALALSGASIATQLMTLDNQSTVAEAYRALRTSVLLSSAGHPPKSILVTSGRPGEGKTTTAVNTAISLAQLGATVLIIDCDLRRPKVHKVFGITHTHGLSTYLSRETDIDSLIHALPIPNLSLLPCGPTPPNPAELISSEKMREMLTLLGTKFDHIIIDSPPLINVTDPVILSTMVDGVIMVVHAGKSTRDVIRRASQELTSVGAKVFGVVLNNVNLQREGYDEYYYQRYYSSYSSDNDISNGVNGNGNGNGSHD